jgi:hypothetical protein
MRKGRAIIHTQWAGQFYTAAELSRREYVVTFTFGNTPRMDLLAKSPAGTPFKVECKSQQKRNVWLVGDVQASDDLFYVLVLVPLKDEEAPTFYIVPSRIVKRKTEEEVKRAVDRGAKSAKTFKAGFPFNAVKSYENAWDKLPP